MQPRTSDNHLYFAYGSNMCAVQMRQRCPSAQRVAVGWLPEHVLVFNRKGSYRPGAVASVTPCENGNCVYGVVWRLSADDLAELDAIEQAYERQTLAISTDGGELHHCHTYIAIAEPNPPPPDEAYVELLLLAAQRAQLPPQYLQHIAQVIDKHSQPHRL